VSRTLPLISSSECQLQFQRLMLLPSSVLSCLFRTRMRCSSLAGSLSHTRVSALAAQSRMKVLAHCGEETLLPHQVCILGVDY
jgi:hypothetical protein